MPGFTGFGKKALPFFKALQFHQSKAWFDENKALYERDVVAPMVALLDDLGLAFAKAGVPLKANGKRSIFRIHRDVRFARDKSPYKTHCGAVMTRSSGKNENGLLYIHISPEGCFAAAGFHMPNPADLARLRKAIAAKPKAFAATLTKLADGKLQLGTESQLTRLPRGFEDLKGSPLEGAVRLKSFIVEEPLPAKLIATPDLVDAIAGFAERAGPLLTFGWKALGTA
jgi:uncharacterized protein (TIGR02453 family)